MTPQEREMIEGLVQRLKAAEPPQKDREAEELIRARVAEQPSAPYQLVQTVLVQEHALNAAQARIEQLEKELASGSASTQPAGGTSFLGGLLGRNRWNTQGTAQPGQPQQAAQRSSVPITAPAPAAATAAGPGFGGGGFGGGSSFLGSALTTAAGVAGGALLFQGLQGLLFHNPGPFGPYMGSGFGGGGMGPGGNVYETNVTNYYGDDQRGNDRTTDASDTSSPDQSDGVQDASYDPSDDNVDTDPGSDFGGSEDV
ncbi:MAG TPA: DUF2076 domain-containing protein [Alphaproteobacteria bacterium]